MTAVRLILINVLLVFLVALPLLGAAAEISQRELLQRLDMNAAPLIVDVRHEDEFAADHVPGAINIPHDEIAARLDELRSHQHDEVVVYCESGRRAAVAQGILEQAGFTKVRHLQGDMQSWRRRGLPHERPEPEAGP